MAVIIEVKHPSHCRSVMDIWSLTSTQTSGRVAP
jgi:hypothetical protein